jgi:hypothetical protein
MCVYMCVCVFVCVCVCGGTADWTWGLVLARQALYHLSYAIWISRKKSGLVVDNSCQASLDVAKSQTRRGMGENCLLSQFTFW